MGGTPPPISAAVMTARTPGSASAARRIDAADAAVRDGAAQDRRIQHAVALEIVDILAAAAQKPQILDPLDRAADIGRCVLIALAPALR